MRLEDGSGSVSSRLFTSEVQMSVRGNQMRLAVCSSAPRGLTKKKKKKNTSCVCVQPKICNPQRESSSEARVARALLEIGGLRQTWRRCCIWKLILHPQSNACSHLSAFLICCVLSDPGFCSSCAGSRWLVPPQRWNQLQNLRQGCFQSHLQEVSLFRQPVTLKQRFPPN